MALDLLNSNLLNIQPATQTGSTVAPSQEVLNAYQTLFGREADMPGAIGWTQSGLTGQALLNAMVSGAQGADVQAFENYQKSQIEQGYQDLFGRAPEETGLNYWLNTTNLIGQDLTNALKAGATDSDIGALYNKADTNISGGITAQGIKDYMTQNVNDPYAIYAASEKYNVDPATINAIMGYSADDATGFLNKYNLADLVASEYGDIGRSLTGTNAIDQEGFNYWFNQLQSGAISQGQFEQAFLTGAMDVVRSGYDPTVSSKTIAEALSKGYGGTDLLDKANPLDLYETFGKSGLTVEDILAKNPNLDAAQLNSYISQVPDLYNQSVDSTISSILGADYTSKIDPAVKQNLVDQLLTGDISRADVTDMFAQSGANKQQEAQRLASAYVSMFGGTQDDAAALYAKLLGVDYTGPGKVDDTLFTKVKSIYDTSLTDEQSGLESLLKTAANTEGAENSQFFKSNPSALAVYRDVGDTESFNNAGTGGQYGYLNGIPVLKASEVDQLFDQMGTDYISGNSADRLDNDIGWDTGSLSGVEARGAGAFGIQRQQVGAYDSDSGYAPIGKYTYTGDMVGLANNLGIDPNQFKDIYKTVESYDSENNQMVSSQVLDKSAEDQLYDAINEKTKDFLLIAGKTGTGTTNQSGETSAFTRDDVSGNHASVLYQRVGDKYIPMENTLKYYNGQMELSPGSWFSDTFGGIASIPGIAELSLFTPAAAFYPAIKAAQTAALGGDFGDILKSGAIAFAGQNILPKVAGELSGGLNTAGITSPIINQAITQGLISGGVSTLLGGSGTEGLTSGLISGGIGGALSTIKPEFVSFAQDIGIPKEYAGVFANTLASVAPTILTGGKIDPTKVLMNYLMREGMKSASKTAPTNVAEIDSPDQGIQSIMTSEGRDLGISPEKWESLSPEEQQRYMLEDSQFSKYIKRLMGEGTISYDDGMNLLGSGYRGEGIMRTPTETLYGTNYSNWYELLKDFGMTDPDEVASQSGLEVLRQRENTRDIRI